MRMRMSVFSGLSLFVTMVSLSMVQPGTAAAQLTAGGLTLAGGGGFKVDCSVAVGEDVIFATATPVKNLCATIQADNNCAVTMRLRDSKGVELAVANVNFNNTLARCAKNVASVTLQRTAPGALSTVNWRVDGK